MKEVKRGSRKAILSDSGRIYYFKSKAERVLAERKARSSEIIDVKKKKRGRPKKQEA